MPITFANLIPALRVSSETGWVLLDVLIILGAVLAITTILVLWFKKTRDPAHAAPKKKRKSKHHHTEHEDEEQIRVSKSEHRGGKRRRRKYRKRRQDHRPRNPTLAETGGLPPAHDGSPSQSSS